MEGIGYMYMTGAHIIMAASKADPGNGRTVVSLGVAIVVARDRWTDADTQQYGTEYRDVISKWAGEIEHSLPGRRPKYGDTD